MTEVTETESASRRRIDRVLDPAFSSDVSTLSVAELRARRMEADAEENDLSYLRRVLHGRLDMLDAEISRRESRRGTADVVAEVVRILSTPPPAPGRSPRALPGQPSRLSEHRRAVERLIADPAVSYVTALTDESLQQVRAQLAVHEREVSDVRRKVQAVVDLMSAELTVRHRNGDAGVNNLQV
jgi:hypothetical protein